jgi:hypothetical protein
VEELMRKKKRVRALKLQHRQKKTEEVATAAAMSWRNFSGSLAGAKRPR